VRDNKKYGSISYTYTYVWKKEKIVNLSIDETTDIYSWPYITGMLGIKRGSITRLGEEENAGGGATGESLKAPN
jgi:hypothetical protein